MAPAWPQAAALGLLLWALAAPGASARELVFTAHDDGTASWFEVEGYAGRNPVLAVEPGENITIRFVNEGNRPHNLAFGPPVSRAMPCCYPAGGNATSHLVVPEGAAGRAQYLCQLHDIHGMRGYLELPGPPDAPTPPAAAPPTAPPSDGGDARSPAPPLAALAAVGLAAAIRRRTP